MRKLTPFEKFGLIAAIIVAGTWLYMTRVYDPQYKKFKKTVGQLNQVIKQYNALQDPPPELTLKKTIEKRKADLKKVQTNLAEKHNIRGQASETTEVLSQVNQQAEKLRLAIIKITPAGKLTGTYQTWNAFTLEMEGTFDRFLRFLEELKEMVEPVQFETIRVENVAAANGWLRISMTLKI